MSKHQVCANCYCGFVGPDSGIGSNLCDTCSVELHGECQGQLTELEAELERRRTVIEKLQTRVVELEELAEGRVDLILNRLQREAAEAEEGNDE